MNSERAEGSGMKADSGFRVQGSGFRVQGSGFRKNTPPEPVINFVFEA
jgi:hypothetical protein